jgi:hypothetical protein
MYQGGEKKKKCIGNEKLIILDDCDFARGKKNWIQFTSQRYNEWQFQASMTV